jgi:small-conductance mechanosensitive channel
MDWQAILQGLDLDGWVTNTPVLVMFVILVALSLIVGRWTPSIVRFGVSRMFPPAVVQGYDQVVEPVMGPFRAAGTLLLLSFALTSIAAEYPTAHGLIRPLMDLLVIFSVAWLVSQLFRQVMRSYGVEVLKRVGLEVDEMLLVFETIANVMIGFIAVLIFAQSQQFNLVGLFASLGIGGLAIAFAAQKILEQLLSTIVLYLDRPFIPGEYIRMGDGHLGRVESIGLRSTKIRTAAKSTLIILPNSTLISMEIENVSRAKKVMVMLYLDFVRALSDEDAALVKQVVNQSTEAVYGIDPGSTSVVFTSDGTENGTPSGRLRRARVTFFILGGSDNSIELRKRLLQLGNETIAKRLDSYGIRFTTQDPTVYIESPVTL